MNKNESASFPRVDIHTHTLYCDGADTPQGMVEAAIALGMEAIGFSGHSYVQFDLDCCMTREDTFKYRREIVDLRERYRERIDVLCGIEQDLLSNDPAMGYDYVIGSVHYLPSRDGFFSVDLSAEELVRAVNVYYNGRFEGLWKDYFSAVAQLPEKTGCGIIGHFDLIAKFNEGGKLFDETMPYYLTYATAAIDRLIDAGMIFEVNTGAVSRGYRKLPYPSLPLLNYIASKGGRAMLSSDAHTHSQLLGHFALATDCLRMAGFSSVWVLSHKGWEMRPI